LSALDLTEKQTKTEEIFYSFSVSAPCIQKRENGMAGHDPICGQPHTSPWLVLSFNPRDVMTDESASCKTMQTEHFETETQDVDQATRNLYF
jgi:hypothetical protein